MKLYFSPGTCSLSPLITLSEAGLPFELERVAFATKTTKSGKDYRKINPKGFVPALELDDGRVLTEGPAIVQYLADLVPDKHLAPPPGSFERVRLQEWLNFISTELHKGYSPLFNKKIPDETKALFRETLATKLDFASQALSPSTFLLGDTFTVADAYLFTVLEWTKYVGLDLATWSVLLGYVERIAARPSVQAARAAEQAHK